MDTTTDSLSLEDRFCDPQTSEAFLVRLLFLKGEPANIAKHMPATTHSPAVQ